LAQKSNESNSHHHPFNILEVVNLPKAIQNPLATFSYGDKTKAQNIITQISIDGKNVLVGISLNPEVGGEYLEINSIRSLYPKDNGEWLNWTTQKDSQNNDKLLYVDKKRVLDLIDQQRTTLADVTYLNLNSVTKVVQNFQNPKLSQKKVGKNIKATPSEALKKVIEIIETKEPVITTKKQVDMKRTLTIALLLSATLCGAQTHFPKNFNVDLGGGINDAVNYTPVAAVGYTFNNWFALYGRYSFATGKIEENRLTYWEHTGEVYTAFTVLSYMDKWFVSPFIGIAYKYQDLLGIPTPSRDVKGHNFGGIVGVEGEWHFARFASIFASASYRGLFFKEEPRYEPFASIGVRTSMRVFRKASRRTW
jgi:hypothetical protein